MIDKIEKKYDSLYTIADYLIKLYNPCKIKNGRCINRIKTCCNWEGSSCQARCVYLSKKGCTVKSLGCKLFLCYKARANKPGLANIIYMLNRIVEKDLILHTVVRCYQSRNDFTKKIERKKYLIIRHLPLTSIEQ